MRKFHVDYIDKSDDLCHVWVNAVNEEDAIERVEQEYWDIKRIVQVYWSSVPTFCLYQYKSVSVPNGGLFMFNFNTLI